MRVFVTGASGFVGQYLVAELRQHGHDVVALRHRMQGEDPAGVQSVIGDVTDATTYEAALATCDAVIHLVGIIREIPKKQVTFERLHVQATAAVVAATERAGIKRYIQMSALGTREGAISGYHRTKWAAEEIVRNSSLDWTIFRPSLIFGPRDSFVNMLAATLRSSPIMPLMGDGTYRLQPIHVRDVVRCFREGLIRTDTVKHTYELCGCDRIRYRDLLDDVARAMGKLPPLKPQAPLWLMKPVIALLQRFAWFPITRDQLQMLLEENICDGNWQQSFPGPLTRFGVGIREYL